MDLSISSGTRAPGSGDVPNYPDNDEDDDEDDNNKGEMSVGAIGGIVVGAIAAFIVAVIIVVKCGNREIVPKNHPVQSVPAPPAAVSYSVPTPAYPPYDPRPGVPVHSTSIDVAPPSYDQVILSRAAQAPAPPYNPYYKGVIAF